jgi:hypothetical protein
MPPVRRLLRWALVTLGIAALARWLRSRREHPAPAPSAPATDPAVELRRKLAESRAGAGTAPAPGEPPAESVDERRAAVHERGRSALSEMSPPDEG